LFSTIQNTLPAISDTLNNASIYFIL